ncbi:Hypothetical predicted protein [Olea europaea subsp. europaea]|uniref:Uncharacterized protein n=1 Tax=Olea europaea subsp. europaea TaxID=158383 RepID=A0A8S0T077_OLEEU|nr:Hypothetical predicted protein [Olea europaea subsp. europaea]
MWIYSKQLHFHGCRLHLQMSRSKTRPNLRKYEADCPFHKKRLVTTTITTDKIHLEERIKREDGGSKDIEFDVNTRHIVVEDEKTKFLTTLVVASEFDTLMYQTTSDHHANNRRFVDLPLKLLNYLSGTLLNLEKDLAIYGAEDMKLEATVEKALGMKNGGAIGSAQMKKR